MTTLQTAAVAGAVVGLGLLLAIQELLPARPDLNASLSRLHQPLRARAPAHRVEGAQSAVARAGRWLAAHRAPHARGIWAAPLPDLAVVGRSVEEHLGRKALMALLGLLLPPSAAAALALAGLPLPVALPALAGLGMSLLFLLLPDLLLRQEAAEARVAFRRAMTAYLELIALERVADGGPAQALERAAAVGLGEEFSRLSEALGQARLSGSTPWAALSELGRELGVEDLSDLADIVAVAGDDGAAIHDTLTAKAAALRTRALAESEAEANAASEKLTLPGVLLGFAFLLLVCYPALARVLGP
jgi:pilus assembly protein TadC